MKAHTLDYDITMASLHLCMPIPCTTGMQSFRCLIYSRSYTESNFNGNMHVVVMGDGNIRPCIQ